MVLSFLRFLLKWFFIQSEAITKGLYLCTLVFIHLFKCFVCIYISSSCFLYVYDFPFFIHNSVVIFFFWLLLSFCGFVFDFKMCNFIDLFLESNLLTLLWDILYTLRLYRFITILMIFKRDCKLFLIMTFDLGNKIVQTVSTITCQNVPSVSLTAWTQDSFLVFYVCL